MNDLDGILDALAQVTPGQEHPGYCQSHSQAIPLLAGIVSQTALALAPVISYPAANGGGVALVGLAGRGHVLRQAFNILLPNSGEVGLQFGQLGFRKSNILVTPQMGGRGPSLF